LNFRNQIDRERERNKNYLETKADLSVFDFKGFQITASALLYSTQIARFTRIMMICNTIISLFLPMMKKDMAIEL
jgi:hypothetical protein